MHVIVWEFQVKPERLGEFCAAYGPGGEWAMLFRLADGYEGTDLLT